MTRCKRIMLTLSVVFVSSLPAAGVVRYVDGAADLLPHDGSSWCNAFLVLQDALDVANSGDIIRVADGTHYPDRGRRQTLGDRSATFQLPDGVSLKGSFDGCGAADPFNRDLVNLPTVLSGDLSQNDVPDFGNRTDNSFHVVSTDSTVQMGTVLDGFTISGGNATAIGAEFGGGMYNNGGDPAVTNVRFTDNEADFGGGMYNGTGSDPVISVCFFEFNRADVDGAGLYIKEVQANIDVFDSEFRNNLANFDGTGLGGGGAWVGDGTRRFTMKRCNFSLNEAKSGGGAYLNGADATFTLCRSRRTWPAQSRRRDAEADCTPAW